MLKFIEKKQNIQIYENDFYKVFFEDEGERIAVRTIPKEFRTPRIECFNGALDVNVSATGNMTSEEFKKHLQILDEVMTTMNQIEIVKSILEREF